MTTVIDVTIVYTALPVIFLAGALLGFRLGQHYEFKRALNALTEGWR